MFTSGFRRITSSVAVSAILFSGICSVCPFAIRPAAASVDGVHSAHSAHEGHADACKSAESVSGDDRAALPDGCPMRHPDPGEIGPDSSYYRGLLLRSALPTALPYRDMAVPPRLAADLVVRTPPSYLPRPPDADLVGTIVKIE